MAGSCEKEDGNTRFIEHHEGAQGFGRATLRHGFSFLTCKTGLALLDQLYSHRRWEVFAGYSPRRGYTARGSGGSSVWPCGFEGRRGFAPLPPNFPQTKLLLYGKSLHRKTLVSFIFHSLVRKKEKLSREGSRGWDFDSFGQLFCCLLLLPPALVS